MEIFGGFMAMMSMAMLFLAVVWLIMPFVVFAIKGKQELTIELLEDMKNQIARLEKQLQQQQDSTIQAPVDNAETINQTGLKMKPVSVED